MTVYQVRGRQPTQVYPNGVQSEVTLYNRGPATVYAGEFSSVSKSNGYELPALSSMRWRANRPLYLASDTASVTDVLVDTGAINGDISRSSVYNRLGSQTATAADGAVIGFDELEVSSYTSLILTHRTSGTTNTLAVFPTIYITWYDADRRIIATDEMNIWTVPGKVGTINIPVRGFYVSIIVSGATLDEYPNSTVMCVLYGTTKELQQSWASERNGYKLRTGNIIDANGVSGTKYCQFTIGDTMTTSQVLLGNTSGQTLNLTFKYNNGSPDGTQKIVVSDAANPVYGYGSTLVPNMTVASIVPPPIPVPRNRVILVSHDVMPNNVKVHVSAVFTD